MEKSSTLSLDRKPGNVVFFSVMKNNNQNKRKPLPTTPTTTPHHTMQHSSLDLDLALQDALVAAKGRAVSSYCYFDADPSTINRIEFAESVSRLLEVLDLIEARKQQQQQAED